MSARLWIKICAMTVAEDAAVAAEAGADAIGLIFASISKRRVTVAQARDIAGQAHAIERIGIFHDAQEEEIVGTFEAVGLSGVQLHGQESAELVAQLRRRLPVGAKIIKSIQFGNGCEQLAERYVAGVVDAILLDSAAGAQGGGTGKRFDWSAAAETVRRLRERSQVIVAGGLAPESVGEAVATLQPDGVDVVSGVEATVGRKDSEKVRAFIHGAREAATQVQRGAMGRQA
jgi:phosphoribosylanthranilate isomerase